MFSIIVLSPESWFYHCGIFTFANTIYKTFFAFGWVIFKCVKSFWTRYTLHILNYFSIITVSHFEFNGKKFLYKWIWSEVKICCWEFNNCIWSWFSYNEKVFKKCYSIYKFYFFNTKCIDLGRIICYSHNTFAIFLNNLIILIN